jgi:hypothetical protein
MKNKIVQFIEKLSVEKHADNPHCDISSSRVQMVKTPIPTELYRELETMASEYQRDLQCLAGDFLTLALEEAIANIPKKEKDRLYLVRRQHEYAEAEHHKELCQFSAGGT